MKNPATERSRWEVLDELDSTQERAARLLKEGRDVGLVFARHQVKGVGRFGRAWWSEPGQSLTMTLIFSEYAAHPRPYLVGMAVAIAAAGAIHSRIQWPNDLVIESRKVGGVLTELKPDSAGRLTPIVGIGINLNQEGFPAELKGRAISLHQAHGGVYQAEAVAESILDRLELLPEPGSWNDLAPLWDLFDATPGKRYGLADGRSATAVAIASEGQLICSVEGETTAVMAAEALFGAP